MNRKRFVIIALLAMTSTQFALAESNVNFTLEITGIMVNQGNVYVDIFSNERDFRRNTSSLQIVLDSSAPNIIHSFDLMEGEYVFAIFQDRNNNGELDTNFFGIPREPFAISNYSGGIPNFNRLKFTVNNNSSSLTISLKE